MEVINKYSFSVKMKCICTVYACSALKNVQATQFTVNKTQVITGTMQTLLITTNWLKYIHKDTTWWEKTV